MNPRIRLAESREDVARCHPVMRELRPRFEFMEFVDQVERQRAAGYRLAFVESAGSIEACAGYRVLENLAWGRFLYVDDLVTTAGARSQGYGAQMFEWLVAQARAEGCVEMHLESGVQRFAAHRFYLRERLEITSHHFALKL